MINTKNKSITNKNESIQELNNLADAFVSKGGEINTQSKELINDTKKMMKEVESNSKK